MEEIESSERSVVCALFRAFPEAYVWIGGSVLQLVHSSPRASYDLDLVPRSDPPPARAVTAAVRDALDEWNAATGNHYVLEDKAFGDGSALLRLGIVENGAFRFTVDITRIAGNAGATAVVLLESTLGPQAVVIPTPSSFLLQKVEALLFRRFLKLADVFDVWFLLAGGARLARTQRDWLSGRLRMEELGRADVEERLESLSPARFLSDIRRRLRADQAQFWDERKAKSALGAVRRYVLKGVRAL